MIFGIGLEELRKKKFQRKSLFSTSWKHFSHLNLNAYNLQTICVTLNVNKSTF